MSHDGHRQTKKQNYQPNILYYIYTDTATNTDKTTTSRQTKRMGQARRRERPGYDVECRAACGGTLLEKCFAALPAWSARV